MPGYEVLGKLGRGGMGIVYKARQVRLNRLVALKMILAGGEASPQELARFRTEAQAVARLQHPNIVQIYEVGEHDEQPYFSLELVDGGSLDKQIQGAAPEPRRAAELVRQLALAVHYAHQRGIVHRDLKPANVLLTAEGTPKITDFGLAKRLEGETAQTQSGAIMGTPGYMAPEQAAGQTHQIGPAVDIHALGAILYELLTGQLPFHGSTVLETLEQVRTQDPVPPRQLQPKLPRDLETICLKCLQKLPQHRYASAAALAEDLQRFLAHEPIQARPSSLWMRGVKWARRRPSLALALLGGGFLLLTLLGVAGWYWDRYQRVKVAYYSGWVKRWGAYEGVGRLTEAEARRRQMSFKFYSRAGLVEAVESLNGLGRLMPIQGHYLLLDDIFDNAPTAKREVRFEFKRNENGLVTEEIASDRTGQVVWRFHYTTDTTAHFTDKNGFARPRIGSGASHVSFTRSPEGLDLEEVYYRDKNGGRRPGRDKTYGFRYLERNRFGQPTCVAYHGPDGQPMLHRAGFARATLAYDERGNCIEWAFWGPEGQPRLHSDGYARRTVTFDAVGNPIEIAFWGPDGRPTHNRDGVAKLLNTYDDHGRCVQSDCFDEASRLTYHQHGFARTAQHYDDQGRCVAIANFGTDGKPVRHRAGHHRMTLAYDDRGDCVALAFYDLAGQPTLHQEGNHRLTRAYDDEGREIERAFFGLDGQPVTLSQGYARAKAVYDDRGNWVASAFFDGEGKPVLHRDGYHKWTAVHDDRGNEVERTFLGLDGRPVALPADGYARRKSFYDDRGNEIQQQYFGPGGEPVLHRDGNHGWSAVYDERGRRTEQTYLDFQQKPIRAQSGYARATMTYDDRGLLVQQSYFEVDGKPVSLPQGFAMARAQYDPWGNRIEESYFGVDGQPVSHQDGYHRRTATLDQHGNVLEYSQWDTEGRPARLPQRPSRLTTRYDAQDRKVEQTRSGYDGSDGFTRQVTKYDERGNVLETACFDESGRLAAHRLLGWARFTQSYDAQNNPLQVAYFDTSGGPVRVQVVIVQVTPDGQAQRVGIQPGDRLLTYDGKEVTNQVQLTRLRRAERPEEPARELKVFRQAEMLTFPILPGLMGVLLEDRAVGGDPTPQGGADR